MINEATGQELWLYIETFIVVDGKPFAVGVTWSDYSVNEDGSYTIHSDISGEVKDYIIPKENALETNRFVRATNIPTDEWKYRKSNPSTYELRRQQDINIIKEIHANH